MENNTITIGPDCSNCKYSNLIEESKRDVFIYCSYKNKKMYYGQRIICDDKEKA